MKTRSVIIFTLLLLLWCSLSVHAQKEDQFQNALARIAKTNEIIKEKGYKWKAALTSMSLLSKEEIRKRCGIISDSIFNPLEQKQSGEKLYHEWRKTTNSRLNKTTTSINWQEWMSTIEDQGAYGNCWAHASTGVAEGLLHYLYG